MVQIGDCPAGKAAVQVWVRAALEGSYNCATTWRKLDYFSRANVVCFSMIRVPNPALRECQAEWAPHKRQYL